MAIQYKRLALVVSLCVTPLLLTACGHPPRAAATGGAADGGTVVATQNSRLGDVSRVITVTGSLSALQEVPLSVKQPGRLASVSVREGDAVTTGQVLATVDDSDLQRQVRSGVATVASCAAKLRQAEAAYKQQMTTVEATITSARAAHHQQVTTSAASEQSAQSALKAARANLSVLQEGARTEERTQTQAALQVAEANCRKANADLTRYTRLHGAGAISNGELDQYVTARDVAAANLQSARAAAEMQRNGTRRQDLEQAQERVRQAEEALRQARAARAQDAVRKADLDVAIANRAQNRVKLADVEAARASLKQAQNTLATAQQAVSDAVIRAPFSGRISARLAEPGQVVASSTVVLRLVTTDGVFFEPSVPDDQASAVRVGQPVDVKVDGCPNRVFAGTVSRVYPMSSSENRSVTIRVTIPDGHGLLRPQVFATGGIRTETHQRAVLVPRSAVVSTSNGDATLSRVYTVSNGVAHERKITQGLSAKDEAWVEVTGIGGNTPVVVQGLSGIGDGARVTVNSSISN